MGVAPETGTDLLLQKNASNVVENTRGWVSEI